MNPKLFVLVTASMHPDQSGRKTEHAVGPHVDERLLRQIGVSRQKADPRLSVRVLPLEDVPV